MSRAERHALVLPRCRCTCNSTRKRNSFKLLHSGTHTCMRRKESSRQRRTVTETAPGCSHTCQSAP
eukprot:364965-Chlamydomonas_euryale.AAC.23